MLNGAQLHLILNHLPIVGFVLFLPLIGLASLSRRTDYQRMALIGAVFVGLLALPAFWTGEPAEDRMERYTDVSKHQIEEHEEAAELALVAALITSGLAATAWFFSLRHDARLRILTPATALLVLLTAGLMAWVGHEGGKIRHPEISAVEPGPDRD